MATPTNEKRNREVRQHLEYVEKGLGVSIRFISIQTGINYGALNKFKAGHKNFLEPNLNKLENFYSTRYKFPDVIAN